MAAREIKAGRAFVEMYLKDRAITRGLRRLQRRMSRIGQGFRSLGRDFAVGATTILVPLGLITQRFASFGDVVDKTSGRTGVGAESISGLGFAAEQTGSDVQTLEKGLFGLSRAVFDAQRGSKEAFDSFKRLGIEMDDLEGKSPEEQFKLVAEGLSRVTDESTRGAIAQKLLGRAGRQLLPLLTLGAKGIEAYMQQARELGNVMSKEDAAAAAELTDALNETRVSFRGIALTIGATIAPVLTKVLRGLTSTVVAVGKFVSENRRLFLIAGAVGLGLASIAAVLTTLGVAFAVGAVAVGGLAAGVAAFASLAGAILTPVGLLITAILGVGAAWAVAGQAAGNAVNWLRDRFHDLQASVLQVMRGVSDAIAAGDIKLAVKVLWSYIKLQWLRGTGYLKALWYGVTDTLLGAWITVQTGIAKFAISTIAAVRSAWAIGTSALKKLWINLSSGVRNIWSSTVGFVSDTFLKLRGMLDSDFDVDAALDINRSNRQADQANTRNERDAALAQARQDEFEALGKIGKQEADLLTALKQNADARRAAIGQAQADRVNEAVADFERAEAEYQSLLKQARVARDDKERTTPDRSLLNQFDDLLNGINTAGRASPASAQSIFGAGSIGLLGLSGPNESEDLLRRIDRNTDQTERNTREANTYGA